MASGATGPRRLKEIALFDERLRAEPLAAPRTRSPILQFGPKLTGGSESYDRKGSVQTPDSAIDEALNEPDPSLFKLNQTERRQVPGLF